MDRAANHRKSMMGLLAVIFLCVAQLKPLHYLLAPHSTAGNRERCSIQHAQRHCTVCDYHFSAAIAATPPAVDFTVRPYVLFRTVRFSYHIPTVIFNSFKRGPPASLHVTIPS